MIGLAFTPSGQPQLISNGGPHVISCTATDPPANSASASDTVKISTRAPVVSYNGNALSDTVDQNVNIGCTASDSSPGSGLASSTCANVTGPAYSFAVGANAFSADAIGNVSNTGDGSVTFIVQVTPSSLCQVTTQFVESSAKLTALPPPLKAMIEANLASLCTALANANLSNPQLNAAAIAAYDKAVQLSASLAWLISFRPRPSPGSPGGARREQI